MLYLASASSSRKYLLDLIRVPYHVIGHVADESSCDSSLPLEQLVTAIAELKMTHAQLPKNMQKGDTIFVLTADTLSCDNNGEIHGKPVGREDAIKKIKKLRGGSRISTAFCLEKKVFDGQWTTERRITEVVSAECSFEVPDEWIDKYIANSPALSVAGAIAIEEYGLQFLKEISGSYTTIVGLPLFELRCALQELGFFSETVR